ncbi:MAG: response regulator [Bacteroidetes bacterium]|jgi:FixJ family two-component response regulator|nr:response regulator [Bacteroidota bacterium]
MSSEEMLRVLIVDDEDPFRLAVEMALKLDGYAAKSYSSPEIAIDALKEETYDVMIVDFYMPGMNGIEFMLWLKEHGIDTPVIMLTAAGSETTAVEVMKAGAYEYFRKDQINTSHLASVIRSVHEKHRIAREKRRIEAEQRRLHDRETELASLQMFQKTVNSLGQFVESGLTTLSKTLTDKQKEVLAMVDASKAEKVRAVFGELTQGVEGVAKGIKSMTDLSALVTSKIEGLQPHPAKDGDAASDRPTS